VRRALIGLLAAVAICAGCARAPTREAQTPPAPPAYEAGVELPDGRGRDLLITSCLGCHDLTGLPLFAPFYAREGWYTLVLTMQAHGADVDNAEIEVLADYLAQHF
jgi:mono/diheme cytochrome c family protein